VPDPKIAKRVSAPKRLEKNKNDVIDSVLVVDIPGELKLKDYGVYNPNINTISLISPTTKKDRIESIAKNSSGFVYYVTLRGVTGASNLDVNEISSNIEEIKKASQDYRSKFVMNAERIDTYLNQL